ncbi:MAG: ATPase [Zetaproteobacteria bacterium CG1_02_53_45]|nr:MAG: ATPase [Zetaproteobacteria bacterium CG1_02_53_45]
MEAVVKELNTTLLNPEWERIELLCHYLVASRRGRELDAEHLDRLRSLQDQVQHLRQGAGAWAAKGIAGLSPLEFDMLACVVAPEMEPRIGWLYQDLQPGISKPYPSPALIQGLTALQPHQAGELYEALDRGGLLRQMRLIRMHGSGSYDAIQPELGLAMRLMGRPVVQAPPPGSVPVDMQAGWDDLVLPADRIAMLHEYLLWIQHHDVVVGQWGGARVGGPVALFAGASGTGKTFAASVIAGALGWQLFRVDLGRLVSKYIGETEQNLNNLFEAAHGRPMVLQFDEADSLFGKRGEVKEARDRYANMGVSHLLACIESHHGPCILTSNLRTHLDPAFARRFQMVIEFPRPDAAARTQLWRRLLPPGAPRLDEVDLELLGRSVTLSGGHIRNAALHAAYLAAGENKPISLRHIALAVWRELAKDGREISTLDMGALAGYLPGELKC